MNVSCPEMKAFMRVNNLHGLGATATNVATRNRASLSPDHQQVLRTLLADPALSASTRECVLHHMLTEEDPRLLAQVSGLGELTDNVKYTSLGFGWGVGVGLLAGVFVTWLLVK